LGLVELDHVIGEELDDGVVVVAEMFFGAFWEMG
jgi:hypothetical protein